MHRQNTIRRKTILFFAAAITIVALSSLYGLLTAVRLQKNVQSQYETEIYLKNLQQGMKAVKDALQDFLITGTDRDKNEYTAAVGSLQKAAGRLRIISQDQEDLMLNTIRAMIGEYLKQTKGVVEGKLLRDSVGYTAIYTQAEKTAAYINYYIDKVLIENLNIRADAYQTFSSNYQKIQFYTFIMLTSSILFTFVLTLFFTDRLTGPIIQLAAQTKQLAQGRFGIQDIRVKTNDEVSIMAHAFNEMKNNIKEYIEELHEKAEIEKSLTEQKLKNLKMQSLLKDAEADALRAQIDPHFLFNTLNTGVQLAIMEDAERTAEYMQNLAHLFRHTVRLARKRNTLGDELEGLKYYMYLINIRFPGKYNIHISVPEQLYAMLFPPLIFQPLIENSILRGLSEMEGGGKIVLTAEEEKERILFTVRDNGCGMDGETITDVLRPMALHDDEGSPQSGIGLRNVVLRLRLYFDEAEIVSIDGTDGTTVRIAVGKEKIRYV